MTIIVVTFKAKEKSNFNFELSVSSTISLPDLRAAASAKLNGKSVDIFFGEDCVEELVLTECLECENPTFSYTTGIFPCIFPLVTSISGRAFSDWVKFDEFLDWSQMTQGEDVLESLCS